MGDCNRSLQKDIDSTMDDIKNFSARMEDLPDEQILRFAEYLVEDIKSMIEAKKIIKENLKYERLEKLNI